MNANSESTAHITTRFKLTLHTRAMDFWDLVISEVRGFQRRTAQDPYRGVCGDAERLMVRYYILFENYEQGLALHGAQDEAGVMNRITPAPATARGTLCCGMSLLVEADAVERARAVIREKNAVYHSIVPVENQLQPRRDRYC